MGCAPSYTWGVSGARADHQTVNLGSATIPSRALACRSPGVVEGRLISHFSQNGGGNSAKNQQLSAIAIRHPFIFFSIADKKHRQYRGRQGRRRCICSTRPRSGRQHAIDVAEQVSRCVRLRADCAIGREEPLLKVPYAVALESETLPGFMGSVQKVAVSLLGVIRINDLGLRPCRAGHGTGAKSSGFCFTAQRYGKTHLIDTGMVSRSNARTKRLS
jgi:hypothetical protein